MKPSTKRRLVLASLFLAGVGAGVLVSQGLRIGRPTGVRFGVVAIPDASAASTRTFFTAIAPTGSDAGSAIKALSSLGIETALIRDLWVDTFAEEYAKSTPAAVKAYMAGAGVDYSLVKPVGYAHHQVYIFVDAQDKILDVQVNTLYTGP